MHENETQDAQSANPADVRARLEELRVILRAENMSYGELSELQDLAPHIDPDDVELLEAAGVPEFPDDHRETARDRLLDVIATLEDIAADETISPTPYSHLLATANSAREAARFPLDAREATP